jgi:glyoxylase-like metal-dependent hydrolase (beta-lactamase superfamily II)
MTADFTTQHGALTLTAVVTDPPWFENCYIVQHSQTGEQLVIDPGSNPERILAALKANGGPVREILLTHGHPDHLGAVRALQEALDVPCRGHEDEAPMVANIADYARRRLGMSVEVPLSFVPFPTGTGFTLGDQSFTAIPTPGHTPGGVCYAFDGFVLTGDTLFNHGVGRTDLPGGDQRLLVGSISTLLDQLPADAFLYSGHGPRWGVDEARPWWSAMRGWGEV